MSETSVPSLDIDNNPGVYRRAGAAILRTTEFVFIGCGPITTMVNNVGIAHRPINFNDQPSVSGPSESQLGPGVPEPTVLQHRPLPYLR